MNDPQSIYFANRVNLCSSGSCRSLCTALACPPHPASNPLAVLLLGPKRHRQPAVDLSTQHREKEQGPGAQKHGTDTQGPQLRPRRSRDLGLAQHTFKTATLPQLSQRLRKGTVFLNLLQVTPQFTLSPDQDEQSHSVFKTF